MDMVKSEIEMYDGKTFYPSWEDAHDLAKKISSRLNNLTLAYKV